MKKIFPTILFAVATTFAAQAATLYTNTFDAAPTLAPNLTGGGFSGGGNVTSGTTTNGSVVYGSALNAVTFDRNYTFSLTLAQGFTFTLSSVSFDYRETTTSAANFTFAVNSNSYATTTLTKNSTYNATGNLAGVFSIASPSAPQVINFNLGFTGGTSASGTIRVDNVVLLGTIAAVPVPEPQEYAIAIAGLMGVLILIRRRKAAMGN